MFESSSSGHPSADEREEMLQVLEQRFPMMRLNVLMQSMEEHEGAEILQPKEIPHWNWARV